MPEFIRPQRAIIIEGGGDGFLAALATAAAVLGIGAVVAWILGHIVVILITAAAGGALIGGGVLATVRFLSRYTDCTPERAPQPALPLSVQAAILARPRQAIAPAQHLHFHFHGVSAEDAAAIIRRQEMPARPAIEENP